MFIFQNTKRKKKRDKETKYQLLHLLFLETESKSSTFMCWFFYIGKFTVHHVSVMRFHLCCCKKLLCPFNVYGPRRNLQGDTALFTPALLTTNY